MGIYGRKANIGFDVIVGTGVLDCPLQNEKSLQHHVIVHMYFYKMTMQIFYEFADRRGSGAAREH